MDNMYQNKKEMSSLHSNKVIEGMEDRTLYQALFSEKQNILFSKIGIITDVTTGSMVVDHNKPVEVTVVAVDEKGGRRYIPLTIKTPDPATYSEKNLIDIISKYYPDVRILVSGKEISYGDRESYVVPPGSELSEVIDDYIGLIKEELVKVYEKNKVKQGNATKRNGDLVSELYHEADKQGLTKEEAKEYVNACMEIYEKAEKTISKGNKEYSEKTEKEMSKEAEGELTAEEVVEACEAEEGCESE